MINDMPTLYQVDAFTSELFKGNPAAVCPMNEWPSDQLLQKIARENNLSETAFFVRKSEGFQLRWFTPTTEIDLCGHATLATAHVLWKHLDYPQDEIRFFSASGELIVKKDKDQIVMDFPADVLNIHQDSTHEIAYAIGREPVSIYQGKFDFLCIFENQDDVANLTPDFQRLKKIKARGIIVTAPGESCDFISRFFAPQSGIDEDPVTGSAHTSLAVYWADKLSKTVLTAEQISERKGRVSCEVNSGRVCLTGEARTFMVGNYDLD